MLSVIVVAGNDEGKRLPAILAALTSAAVEGLVREAVITGGAPAELLAVLRDETGADLADSLGQAIAAAKSELLLVVGAGFRPRLGWIEALQRHVQNGGREALVSGEGGGFLKRAPYGVLIARSKAAGLVEPDLHRLRRQLGHRAPRIG